MAEVSISILDVKEDDSIKTFYNLETAKPDYFHIDVMDGKFVKENNLEKMRDYTLKIHSMTMTPLDVHLMVEEPKNEFDYFIDQGADKITFHYEVYKSNGDILNDIKYLIQNHVKVGIAINPDTDIEKVYEILPYVHSVLIMTVFPGKGGQDIIEATIEKIRSLKNYCLENDLDLDIEADGGINDKNADKVVKAGANIIVSGSYILKSKEYISAVKFLKNI